MQTVMLLFVVGCAVWVGIDASNLGVSRGRLGGGILDMGVASWVLATLLIWIVGFPCYLVARSRYQALRTTPALAYAAPAPQYVSSFASPQPTHAAFAQPAAAPQYSPDGQWWWDGYRWVPVQQPPVG